MRLAAAVIATIGMVAVLAHCVVVTGDTSGYQVRDAGAPGCSSSADCDDHQVCCLTTSLTASGLAAVAACQSGPPCRPFLPGVQPVQFCQSATECGYDAGCLSQRCSPGDASPLMACGHVTGCQLQ
jgi:hypothetical protein